MNELARLIRKCHCGHPEGVHDLHAPFRCFACTCKVFSPGAEDELLTTLKRIADALELLTGVTDAKDTAAPPLVITEEERKFILDMREAVALGTKLGLRDETLQTPLEEGADAELAHEGDDDVDDVEIIGDVFMLPVDVAPRVSKTRKKKPSQKNRAKKV